MSQRLGQQLGACKCMADPLGEIIGGRIHARRLRRQILLWCDQVHIQTPTTPLTVDSAAEQSAAMVMERPMKAMNGRRIAFAIMIGSSLAALPGAAAGSVPGERHAGAPRG